ncbi:MAG: PEP-CTERM sorting domain-containing protein [Candidatus Auribacter fodinae]|jgi:hypothetical protein|uniref:PEP-CTERM sorting domain-containing protein n=1 Tax=Candidatus Auribacter fodinae TaxID=2093366 RepID=A0A3A4QS42_9BACT|nr:MAG: PEP-CTERM sorting domain-containing protein [Candidatus Auribacter fodinae]
MKRLFLAMCVLALTASVANALPERGFPGGMNEVKDSTFIDYVDGGGEEGEPAPPITWRIEKSHFWAWDDFIPMMSGVTGYAYDHDQEMDHYSILTTDVDAEDGGLYNPLAETQMINLSFYAHIDDGGYVVATIKWWDSMDPFDFQDMMTNFYESDGYDGYDMLPDADHEIVIYHEDLDYDNEYRTDFTINGIAPVDGYDGRIDQGSGYDSGYDGYEGDGYDGYDSVMDVNWHVYDLYVYETEIAANPQFMVVEIEIGHHFYWLPSSAYITDIQHFQKSGDVAEIAVPEPATLVLLGIGALAGLVRRFKK